MINRMKKSIATRRRGFWFTTKTGQHIYVDEDETPKQACERVLQGKEKNEKLNREDKKLNNSNDAPSAKGKNKSKEDFFGIEFKGYKNEAAIDKLLVERKGYIKDAFYRAEVGGVDLVWGDESGGLAHTIKRRDAMFNCGVGSVSGVTMVKMIPRIINKGEFGIGKNERPYFKLDGFMVIIKPTYDGKKLNWVLSAMEEIKKSR